MQCTTMHQCMHPAAVLPARTSQAGAVLPSVARTHPRHGRSVPCRAAASDPLRQLSQLPQPISEPLAYAKAIVDVTLRRLADTAMDAAAEVSMAVAEQPQRMREFADEVQAAAQLELQGFGQQQQRLLSTTSSASSGGGQVNSSSAGSGGRQDLEALVDDLRADIAASRALLQQIRIAGSSGPQAQQSRR